ncbi:MAG: ImmA/IrrE family metallo-endopeptidase [Ignavibacteriaceae bacterium]|jgi:Zn-dependent peptidase ImmA (M78 family)
MQNNKAEVNAQKIIDKYFLTRPQQYSLREIINAEGLAYRETLLTGCDGSIVFTKDTGVVTVNSNIIEPTQKNFTAAHELGHFENEREALTPPPPEAGRLASTFSARGGHAKGEEQNLTFGPSPFRQRRIYSGEGRNRESKGEEQNREGVLKQEVSRVYNCSTDDLFSFKINKRREDEANVFASELLMYKPWFHVFTGSRTINFELIKETADYFNVSLTAAILRYAAIGKCPIAVILSCNGEKKWSFISDRFPYKWIEKGYKVRNESAAHYFFKGKETPPEANLTPAFAWFSGDVKCRRDVYFYEQNVVMKSYNSVLTMLWESEWK